jgi:hypothetical protein
MNGLLLRSTSACHTSPKATPRAPTRGGTLLTTTIPEIEHPLPTLPKEARRAGDANKRAWGSHSGVKLKDDAVWLHRLARHVPHAQISRLGASV